MSHREQRELELVLRQSIAEQQNGGKSRRGKSTNNPSDCNGAPLNRPADKETNAPPNKLYGDYSSDDCSIPSSDEDADASPVYCPHKKLHLHNSSTKPAYESCSTQLSNRPDSIKHCLEMTSSSEMEPGHPILQEDKVKKKKVKKKVHYRPRIYQERVGGPMLMDMALVFSDVSTSSDTHKKSKKIKKKLNKKDKLVHNNIIVSTQGHHSNSSKHAHTCSSKPGCQGNSKTLGQHGDVPQQPLLPQYDSDILVISEDDDIQVIPSDHEGQSTAIPNDSDLPAKPTLVRTKEVSFQQLITKIKESAHYDNIRSPLLQHAVRKQPRNHTHIPTTTQSSYEHTTSTMSDATTHHDPACKLLSCNGYVHVL